MALTTQKSAAELAKTSPAELELWQMEISPDEVLRLVAVAIAAQGVLFSASKDNLRDLKKALKGIEP